MGRPAERLEIDDRHHYLTRGTVWTVLSVGAYGIIGYFVSWLMMKLEQAGIDASDAPGFDWLPGLRATAWLLAAGAVAAFVLLAVTVASGRLERAERVYTGMMTYFLGSLGIGVLTAIAVFLVVTRLAGSV